MSYTFDKFSNRGILIMYPTGGYGNFLYKILTDHFESTVKVSNTNFMFSTAGNSHATYKYTEIFKLGTAYVTKQLKSFDYSYKINDLDSANQINLNKNFLVLGDTGNLGDNIKFIRRYFPNFKIIRVYAESFEEKLILWANAFNKSMTESNKSTSVYKTSLHTIDGIAKFANKSINQINDQDAVNCLVHFLKNDFGPYGKQYSKEIDENLTTNFPLKNFFNKDKLYTALDQLATQCNTKLIDVNKLQISLDEFYKSKQYFDLLNVTTQTDPILRQALDKYYAI
jgi:hypothetical protein